MRVNHVLSAVLTAPWLINQQSAEGYLPVVMKMLEQRPELKAAKAPASSTESKPKAKPKPYQVAIIGAEGVGASAFMLERYSSYDEAPEGSIAIVNLDGPMMKEDFCGSPGTKTLGQRIKQADVHPNISAHLLISNTPGGTVAGTEDFSGIIKATTKPFVAFVEGMHSAGYWAGSGANLIIMGGQTASAGSIGTMTTIHDFSGYYEKMGIKTHNIRATASVDKNTAYYEAQAGKPERLRAEVLDPLNEVFLAAVKANRGDKLNLKKEDVLTGKVYHGQTAIDAGLADEIGSLEYAIQRAQELAADESNSNQSTNSKNNMSFLSKNKFPKLAALAGKPAAEVTEEVIEAVNEELAAAGIEHAGVLSSTQLSTLEAAQEQVTQLTQEKAALAADKTKLTNDLATANAEVARLGKLDGAAGTGSAKEGAELSEEGADENQKAIDALEHNQALANNPLFN